MMLDDVIEIKVPEPDSQFRLIPCKCGSDNVAYEHYNGRGGAAWRVKCYACYVPNARADMRHRKKVYQRGRERAKIILNDHKVERSKED